LTILGTPICGRLGPGRQVRARRLLLPAFGRRLDSITARGEAVRGAPSTPIESTLITYDLRRQTGEAGLLICDRILCSTVAVQVEIRLKGRDARLWEEAEPFGKWLLAVLLAMVVRTVRLLAVDTMLALLNLQEIRMVLLLLPTVRVGTLVLVGAPL
jgi:hypothetical protein